MKRNAVIRLMLALLLALLTTAPAFAWEADFYQEAQRKETVAQIAGKKDDEELVTVYAPDGRSKKVKKSQVAAEVAVGWYTEPVTYMYALDGRCKVVPVKDVAANQGVGWYLYDDYVKAKEAATVTVYAPDGRSKQVNESRVAAEVAVGWYTEPVTYMYALDGRCKIVPVKDVAANQGVGWYLYDDYLAAKDAMTPVTVYAPDGRSKQVPKSQVEAEVAVGWHTVPVTTMYAPDGRTIVIASSEVDAYKRVGWYTSPRSDPNLSAYDYLAWVIDTYGSKTSSGDYAIIERYEGVTITRVWLHERDGITIAEGGNSTGNNSTLVVFTGITIPQSLETPYHGIYQETYTEVSDSTESYAAFIINPQYYTYGSSLSFSNYAESKRLSLNKSEQEKICSEFIESLLKGTDEIFLEPNGYSLRDFGFRNL